MSGRRASSNKSNDDTTGSHTDDSITLDTDMVVLRAKNLFELVVVAILMQDDAPRCVDVIDDGP
jgi:hypothetical protein